MVNNIDTPFITEYSEDMTTQPEDQQPQQGNRKPINLLMKIGLISAIAFIFISQLILLVLLPLNLPQTDLLLTIGSTANYLAIVSALVLAAGALLRRYGR
jgi:hypothetical protein